jgi:hypothetical protein
MIFPLGWCSTVRGSRSPRDLRTPHLARANLPIRRQGAEAELEAAPLADVILDHGDQADQATTLGATALAADKSPLSNWDRLVLRDTNVQCAVYKR